MKPQRERRNIRVWRGRALGRWPNEALQRTRPLLRFLPNMKSSGWGPAAEGGRYCDTRSQVVLLHMARSRDSVMRSCPLSPRCGGVTGNGGVSSTQQALGV